MAAKTYTGFLSPKKLNFSAAEKRAAVSVLRMMESGQIIDRNEEPPSLNEGLRFNMSTVLKPINSFKRPKKSGCGSVGCLCGWMSFVMGNTGETKAVRLFRTMSKRSIALYDLFRAEDDITGMSWIGEATTKHGARALRHYLKTGKSDWYKAMGADA